MGHWGLLPAEIRIAILELVAEDHGHIPHRYARAGYSSVCWEWQPIFERRNFRRLVVDQERISDLDRFMGEEENIHRRDYLEHLFLRVRLLEYPCSVCRLKEDGKTIRQNNQLFSKAIWSLLVILSKWTGFAQYRRGFRRQHGVTLELGGFSPSDCRHTCRDFHLDPNYPYQEPKDLQVLSWRPYALRIARSGSFISDDPHHSWVDGHRQPVSLQAKQRITGRLNTANHPEFSTFGRTFPKVEVITNLVIRRQFYRRVAVSSLRKLLDEAFTRLRMFRYEAWHGLNRWQQSRFEKDFNMLMLQSLPMTVGEIYIFEDFNKLLHPERATWHADPFLGSALSVCSQDAFHVSAAFLVDAKDFFEPWWYLRRRDTWTNLRTSRLLHPDVKPKHFRRLLIVASLGAAHMPKLQTMEIWNGGEGHSCVFRYSKAAGNHQISWQSNWKVKNPLNADVVRYWKRAVRPWNRIRDDLAVKVRMNRFHKPRRLVRSHARAFGELKLYKKVLDIISGVQLLSAQLSPAQAKKVLQKNSFKKVKL